MSEQQTSLFSQLAANFSFDFTFESLINNFHFIRPLWLLAFIGLFLLLFLLKKIRYYQSPWQHFLPAHLANALLENVDGASKDSATEVASVSKSRYWLKPVIMGSCIIIALAGPAWQKLPQPVYQLERGAVLIMDMSYSMYATDVAPNRLTRARYKAVDLLNKINEGDVGLIAYAGDAFIISPLTQDIKNIELLLPSLSPDIMPVHGANALAALTLADQTLKNAGHISGDIYWFTDDIENDEMSDVYNWASDNNHKVNILGVGSKVGAPIKLSSGELLKDNRGAIIIPKLPEGRLAAISKRSRGVYHTMTNDDTDIKALTAHLTPALDDNLAVELDSSQSAQEQESKQALQGDQYQEQGPWLLLIILPLILSYFRRGSNILSMAWLVPLTFIVSLVSISPISYAAESNATNSLSSTDTATEKATEKATGSNDAEKGNSASQLWRDLWQTSDQQAQQHYQKEEYQQAANQFENSQWQGSALYKAGEYQQALDAFKQSDSAQALYNQGNALAQLQQLDEAIDAYKKALAKDPNLTDAQDNLAQLEALKEQQQEQQQQSQDGDKEQKNDQQKQDSQQQSEDQSQGDKQEGEQEQGEQQSGEQQESDEAQKQKEAEQNQQQESEKTEEQKAQDEKSRQADESKEEQQSDDEKTLAQQASDSKAQETQQKHQQLLNKVTDDPYLLLRNKMRLEYQKRRQEGAPKGETKKW